MLDVNLLRTDPERVKKAIATKNADPKLVDAFLKVDQSWREAVAQVGDLRAEQHKLSVNYQGLTEPEKEKLKTSKEKIKILEEEIRTLEQERDLVWMKIPNLPSEDTPPGKNEDENLVIKKWGELPKFDFKPRDHVQLGEALGIIDTQRASDVSGTRFSYLKGDLVLLEFALIQHLLSILTNEKILREIAETIRPNYSPKPFTPVIPPVMIRPEVFRKMARLEPEDERYYIPSDDVYLIGSAEHTLGPLHMEQTVPEDMLPLRYAGFSTSFRREAGSYGQDTKGILRQHQFYKLEMESFTLPEDGIAEQDFLVAIQEYWVQSLKLPYQVVMCCTGDQGDPDARHIDIEMWMSGQGKYRETHSADYMTDYQARRLNTKVKRHDGTTEFVHMNDATASSQRPLIAIMENNQTEDGKIEIPEVLQNYVGKAIIE